VRRELPDGVRAAFDRLERKQQHVFDRFGPIRPPRLGESGDPDFIGRAARFGVEVSTWGDVDGLDAYVLVPGCFDDAIASGRTIGLLSFASSTGTSVVCNPGGASWSVSAAR